MGPFVGRNFALVKSGPEIVSQALIASSVVVIGIYYRLLNENHGETVILVVAN